MKTFVRVFAFLAMLNTACGIDLLAHGKFFEPASPAIQIYSWGATLVLGIWAIFALAKGRD